ncbi:DUF1178 family protein [Pelagibacterales bacterium SAG-MED47]|nr:DUF1178 family protein [Pelagibacterales bacterium SAG-MED47]
MIKYRLFCQDCNISFDSWFASSMEYERLVKKNFLNCHNCGSIKVEKTLMAPRLINRSKSKKDEQKNIKLKEVNKKIKEYQKFIKNNFHYVGENFAYEARSIHYKNKKKTKGIYGKASYNEIKDLREEGIVTEIIPWIEDKNN